LNFFLVLRRSHVDDSLDLVQTSFDPLGRDEAAQNFALMHTEDAFGRVQLKIDSSHVHEGLSQVLDVVFLLFAEDNDVVYIGENISADLFLEGFSDHPA
jgi:hypothetical protein